jgi:hypothetical protein
MGISALTATIALTASLALQIPGQEQATAALARAEALWKAQGPKTYRFGIILTCFCSRKGMSFRVVDGQAQVPPDADVASQQFHDQYGTVEKLFALIRRSLEAGAHRAVVKYHDDLGYPIWLDLDPRRDVFDDELFLRVSGFRKSESPRR